MYACDDVAVCVHFFPFTPCWAWNGLAPPDLNGLIGTLTGGAAGAIVGVGVGLVFTAKADMRLASVGSGT